MTSCAGQVPSALDKAFRVLQCRHLTGDEYVFGHWIGVGDSAHTRVALGADFHDRGALQSPRLDKLLPTIFRAERTDVRQGRAMTTLASDPALFTGAERIRLTMTIQAPPLERRTQRSPEFIFIVSRLFQKAGRQNQRSRAGNVTSLNQRRTFEGNA